jgi:hypothetical protein
MIRMLVYLHKRKTGFTKKEKRINIQVHRRSRHRYSRTHNHLPRRHTNQLAVSPTSIPPSPTPPTQERSTHLPKKKRWKHHPHQSNRNRIVPLISQRKTRSTLRIALKCREGNTQSSQRPSHRNSTYPLSLPEEEKWAEYPAFLMPIAGACAPGPHGRYSVQHPSELTGRGGQVWGLVKITPNFSFASGDVCGEADICL